MTLLAGPNHVTLKCLLKGYRTFTRGKLLMEPFQVLDLVGEDLGIKFRTFGVRAAIEEALAEVSGRNIAVSTNLCGTSLVITALFTDEANRCSITTKVSTYYNPHSDTPFGDTLRTIRWFATFLWKKITSRLSDGEEFLLTRVQRAVPGLTWSLSATECKGTRETDGELLVCVDIPGGKLSAWTPEHGPNHPSSLVREPYSSLTELEAKLSKWRSAFSAPEKTDTTENANVVREEPSVRRLIEVLQAVDGVCNAGKLGSATSAIVEEPDGSFFGVIHAEVGALHFEVQVDLSDVGWLYAYDEAGRLVGKAPFDPKNGTKELLKALFPSDAVKVIFRIRRGNHRC